MPVDINNLSDGWLELESDPGLFTLLLEDMGVKGVQVEEIYDLQKGFEGKVYGFIFLFKWIEERRSRRKIVENYDIYVRNENIVNNMFFAQQMVPNSCATHSLVSILLNCNIDLGPTLSRLRAHTLGMSPENKGWAIGNTPELANAHNSHAAPQARRRQDKTPFVPTSSRMASSAETFHFVSYVPINGHLFELDGLKPHPLDHGPWAETEDWTDKFRRVITERLGMANSGEPYHDIRFNLMAVVPDRITYYKTKLDALERNREIVMKALHLFIQNNYPKYAGKQSSSGATTRKDFSQGNNLSLLAVAASRQPETKVEPATEQEEPVEQDDSSSSPTSSRHVKSQNLFKEKDTGKDKEGCSSLPEAIDDYYSTPLTIQTSPLAAPATPSTDTASEVGSAFDSPQLCSEGSTQSSPANSGGYQRLVVVRMAPPSTPASSSGAIIESSLGGDLVDNVKEPPKVDTVYVSDEKLNIQDPPEVQHRSLNEHSKENEDNENLLRALDDMEELPEGTVVEFSDGESSDHLEEETKKTFNSSGEELDMLESVKESGAWTAEDLLRLTEILTTEISESEVALKDELEKRKRYRMDDCRRTHNYDQFIITFVAMLAERGRLGDLVKEQLQPTRKRPNQQLPIPVMRNKSTISTSVSSTKKPELKGIAANPSATTTTSKKRGRKKKTKGKRKR